MNFLYQTAITIGLASCVSSALSQNVSLSFGEESNSITKKGTESVNFAVNGTSYFVTKFSDAGGYSFHVEGFGPEGHLQMDNKLEIDLGTFNNSYSITEVIGLGSNALALIEHLHKETGKFTLSARTISNRGVVNADDTELMVIPFEKVLNSGFYNVVASPDQKLMAVTGQLPYVKDQSAKMKVALYDQDLKILAEREVTLPGEDTKNKSISTIVGNDGTVYMIKKTTSKIGETILHVYQISPKVNDELKEYTFELTAPDYIYSYVYSVNDNSELIIAGTSYERKTVYSGDKKANGIFYFTNKNKSEKVFAAAKLDAPVEILTAKKVLMNGSTVFLAAEQFKEERITPPASAAGTAAAFDYSYNYTHKNEYIIGIDAATGAKKFELNLSKDFTARDHHDYLQSAYFISQDKFNIIYTDHRKKYNEDYTYGSVVPVLVQVTNDGFMQSAVPFLDKTRIPSEYILEPSKYIQLSDNEISMLMGRGDVSKYMKITLN